MDSFLTGFNRTLRDVRSKEFSGNSTELIPLIISLIDLTSLGLDDTTQKITELCQKINTRYGSVAAVCIYPKFVNLAVKLLSASPVKVATVVNFPSGNEALSDTLTIMKQAISDGANEIDLVWPYEQYLQGNKTEAINYVRDVCNACHPEAHLKVILETGKLVEPNIIYQASLENINLGVDFIKTSTGKVPVNATLESAVAMMLAIRDSKKEVGFKAAGGIRTFRDAIQYINAAYYILGKEWVTPENFRFGASALLDDVLSIEMPL